MTVGARADTASAARPSDPAPPVHQPRRGRPTAAQVASIDAAILTAAAARFLAEGFDATAMEAVAAAAQVSKPTLYSRYPSKLALLRAVVERSVADWSRESNARTDTRLGDTLEARLRARAETMLYWSTREEVRAFDRLLNESRGSAAEIVQVLHETRVTPMHAHIAEDIRAFTARDDHPARDPARVATIFMTMMTGMIGPGSSPATHDAGERAAYAETVVAILLHGRAAW